MEELTAWDYTLDNALKGDSDEEPIDIKKHKQMYGTTSSHEEETAEKAESQGDTTRAFIKDDTMNDEGIKDDSNKDQEGETEIKKEEENETNDTEGIIKGKRCTTLKDQTNAIKSKKASRRESKQRLDNMDSNAANEQQNKKHRKQKKDRRQDNKMNDEKDVNQSLPPPPPPPPQQQNHQGEKGAIHFLPEGHPNQPTEQDSFQPQSNSLARILRSNASQQNVSEYSTPNEQAQDISERAIRDETIESAPILLATQHEESTNEETDSDPMPLSRDPVMDSLPDLADLDIYSEMPKPESIDDNSWSDSED